MLWKLHGKCGKLWLQNIKFYLTLVKVKVKSLSRVRLFATLWTLAHQAPLSMRFSRQEYWSGLPFPSPGNLPDPGIKPRSPALQADTLPSEPPGKLCPLFVIPWTVVYQAFLSMGFSRQAYWNGLPFPSPGDLLTQGSNPGLLHCRQTLYPLSHQGSPEINRLPKINE